jgi:hypothetical protein
MASSTLGTFLRSFIFGHIRARQWTGQAASGRGAERFVTETVGRIQRAGATGPLTLRADSGFWSAKVLAACRRHGIRFSITVRQIKTVTAAIAAIDQAAWTDIDYPDGGQAHLAETTVGSDRLIVRRTRLVSPQATLWPDWRYHAFVTDRHGSAVDLDADHRRHAMVELAIRDLKDGAGLRHCPSGRFLANPAWLSSPPSRTICFAGSPPSGWTPKTWWSPRPTAPAAAPPRPTHPLGPPAPAAPTHRLALGRTVPRVGPPTSSPVAHLTANPPQTIYAAAGHASACPTTPLTHRAPAPECPYSPLQPTAISQTLNTDHPHPRPPSNTPFRQRQPRRGGSRLSRP